MPDTEKLTPGQKYSLRKVLWRYAGSTAVFWIPAVTFLAIADEIQEKEPLPGDVAILTSINGLASSWLTDFFIIVTSLGSAPFVIPGVSIAAATLWYIGRRRSALFLLFGAGGTALINMIFKLFFARERPDLWEYMIVESGYSFPSGHAMIASALALVVIILAWHTKYRWYAVVAGVLYTFLVSISRLYLGVHYPSDVLGGWCVSILWILMLHHLLGRYATSRNKTLPLKE